jgi:hypothetical protein
MSKLKQDGLDLTIKAPETDKPAPELYLKSMTQLGEIRLGFT